MQTFSIQYSQEVCAVGIELKLQELLKEKGKKPGTLARETGISKNTIYAIIKRDNTKVELSILEAIAKGLGVSIDRFFENDGGAQGLPSGLLSMETRRVPLLGPVAAGTPILCTREYDEYIAAFGDNAGADASLRVEGDSMAPHYLNGDIVFIRLQPDVDDGDIAAIQIDDNVTLKHIYHIRGGVQLVSDNPAYPPMIFTAENSNSARVIGRAVGYQRRENQPCRRPWWCRPPRRGGGLKYA